MRLFLKTISATGGGAGSSIPEIPLGKDYMTPYYKVVQIIESLNLNYDFSLIRDPRFQELAKFAAAIHLGGPDNPISLESDLNTRVAFWQRGFTPDFIRQKLIEEVQVHVQSEYNNPDLNEVAVLRDSFMEFFGSI